MTPEGRQDLAAVIAKMQEWSRFEGREGCGCEHKIPEWCDRLALLLAEAQQTHAIETALREVVTNGEWHGGVEWVISTAVYEMATEALAALPETSAIPQQELEKKHDDQDARMDRRTS